MSRDPRVEPRQKDCVEKISGMQYFVIDRTPRTVTAITNPRSFCVKYSIKNWREEFATAIIIHAEGSDMETTCPLCGLPITRGQAVMFDESDVEWHAGCYAFSHPDEEDSANE